MRRERVQLRPLSGESLLQEPNPVRLVGFKMNMSDEEFNSSCTKVLTFYRWTRGSPVMMTWRSVGQHFQYKLRSSGTPSQ